MYDKIFPNFGQHLTNRMDYYGHPIKLAWQLRSCGLNCALLINAFDQNCFEHRVLYEMHHIRYERKLHWWRLMHVISKKQTGQCETRLSDRRKMFFPGLLAYGTAIPFLSEIITPSYLNSPTNKNGFINDHLYSLSWHLQVIYLAIQNTMFALSCSSKFPERK